MYSYLACQEAVNRELIIEYACLLLATVIILSDDDNKLNRTQYSVRSSEGSHPQQGRS
jgi:hypothetical protein